jgi:nucleoside-diphosphate-sugar epimerase
MTRALVTGATGFIGGRLVEKLRLVHGWDVRALVRDFSKAARIARFDVEMMPGDFADEADLRRAVAGCQVVFDCAFDAADLRRNVEAAERLARACLDEGVRRVVHVSSLAVYEPLSDGLVNEDSPADPSGLAYGDTKLEVERRLLRHWASSGLPVVVLQPTIVYGPYGKAWTTRIVKELRRRMVILPDAGRGFCNAVYVDDVVDALISSAEAESVEGERFLISGPAPITWADFFGAFERVLGLRSVSFLPAKQPEIPDGDGRIRPRKSLGRMLRVVAARVVRKEPVRRLLQPAAAVLGERLVNRVKWVLPPPSKLDRQQLALYRARARVDIEKARRLLDYEPRYDFEHGMRLTRAFISWANL